MEKEEEEIDLEVVDLSWPLVWKFGVYIIIKWRKGREGQHIFCFERNDALGLLDLVDSSFFIYFLFKFNLVLIN